MGWMAAASAGSALIGGIANAFGANDAKNAQVAGTEHGIHALTQYLGPYADMGLSAQNQMAQLLGLPATGNPYTSQTNVLGLLQPEVQAGLGAVGTGGAAGSGLSPLTEQDIIQQLKTAIGTQLKGSGPIGQQIQYLLDNGGSLTDLRNAINQVEVQDPQNIKRWDAWKKIASTPTVSEAESGVKTAFGGVPFSPTGGAAGAPGTPGSVRTMSDVLTQTPYYNFVRDQGLQGVANSAAARGLSTSGAGLRGAADYTTGLATQTFDNYYNMLSNVMGLGANAASSAGGSIANLLSDRGTAQGAGTAAIYSNLGAIPGQITGGIQNNNILNKYLSQASTPQSSQVMKPVNGPAIFYNVGA